MDLEINQDNLMERGELENHFVKGMTDVDLAGLRKIQSSQEDVLPDYLENSAISTSLWSSWRHKLCSSTKKKQQVVSQRPTIARIVDRCPMGYPRVAALLASDQSLMLYRRFSYLQSRLLLHKQDELRELETDLDNLDVVDESENPRRLVSREEDDRWDGKRLKLLSDIETKFNEYATLLVNAQSISSFNSPRSRDYQKVRAYFDGIRPIRKLECHIYHEEDIASLKIGRDDAWLDAVVEKYLKAWHSKFTHYIFSSTVVKEQAKKSNPDTTGIAVYSRERLENLKLTIIFIMIIIHFVGPVYLLWYLTQASKTTISVAVLIIFTITFSVVLAQFTRANRHELLASAAAYCAVLVVFIGNSQQIPTVSTPAGSTVLVSTGQT